MMCICKFPFAEVLLVCGNVLLTLVHRFSDSFVFCSPCACPSICSQSLLTSDFFPVAIFVKPPHRLSVWSALNSVAGCWNTLWETCTCNNSLSQAVHNFWCWLFNVSGLERLGQESCRLKLSDHNQSASNSKIGRLKLVYQNTRSSNTRDANQKRKELLGWQDLIFGYLKT